MTRRSKPPLRIDTYERVVTTDDPRRGAILTTPASPVVKFNSKVREVAQRMAFFVRHDSNCAGLAAPQINVDKRVIVIRYRDEPLVIVNPEIEPVGSNTIVDYEGCFSLPFQRVRVRRAMEVIASGLDVYGAPIEPVRLYGNEARAVQHEVDHLNGVLILDHGTPEPVGPGEMIAPREHGLAGVLDEVVSAVSPVG